MRVIAGECKGRTLKTVKGLQTRPTGDKMKEAIFHRLGPFFQGGACLDLFAGSGALGIEALSRGMDHAVFIDQSKEAVKIIHHNVKQLKLNDRCEIYRNDAFRAMKILQKKLKKFDLILLDPPYDKVDYKRLMEELGSSELMKENCHIYVEHRPEEEIVYNEDVLEAVQAKKINQTTSFTILKKR